MRHLFRYLLLTLPFMVTFFPQAHAQSPLPLERSAEAFASENAILDTAIPFAIGAREARQALRGAFGWPSFQEGLVEGVYFRFDPDGYARFAPTPRLDVDVFEVICRPRTYACAARKDGMDVFLTERGQLQVKLETALAGDMFFVSEGVSEIQLPERILQPLDVQLELLLGAGGDLVVRRGSTDAAKISLKGFGAVSAYLRWISARQDYSVLPRGWPVPNGDTGRAGTVTQPSAWNSPMPQPQVLSPGYGVAIAPATSAAPITLQAQYPAAVEPAAVQVASTEASVLRAELEVVKQILRDRMPPSAPDAFVDKTQARSGDDMLVHLLTVIDGLQTQVAKMQTHSDASLATQGVGHVTSNQRPETLPQVAAPDGARAMPVTVAPWDAETVGMAPPLGARHANAQQQVPLAPVSGAGPLQAAQLSGASPALVAPRAQVALPAANLTQGGRPAAIGDPMDGGQGPFASAEEGRSEVQKLEFLMSQLGLDMQTAVSVLQMSNARRGAGGATVQETSNPPPRGGEGAAAPTPVLYQNELVDQILAELEAELAGPVGGSEALNVEATPAQTAAVSIMPSAREMRDYQLLSHYFGSAALPDLKEMMAPQPAVPLQ